MSLSCCCATSLTKYIYFHTIVLFKYFICLPSAFKMHEHFYIIILTTKICDYNYSTTTLQSTTKLVIGKNSSSRSSYICLVVNTDYAMSIMSYECKWFPCGWIYYPKNQFKNKRKWVSNVRYLSLNWIYIR